MDDGTVNKTAHLYDYSMHYNIQTDHNYILCSDGRTNCAVLCMIDSNVVNVQVSYEWQQCWICQLTRCRWTNPKWTYICVAYVMFYPNKHFDPNTSQKCQARMIVIKHRPIEIGISLRSIQTDRIFERRWRWALVTPICIDNVCNTLSCQEWATRIGQHRAMTNREEEIQKKKTQMQHSLDGNNRSLPRHIHNISYACMSDNSNAYGISGPHREGSRREHIDQIASTSAIPVRCIFLYMKYTHIHIDRRSCGRVQVHGIHAHTCITH